VTPVGNRLSEPGAPQIVRVLATAPWQLLAHIRRAAHTAQHGVVVSLRGGPSIYFGDLAGLRDKWLAAEAVLSSSGSAGASYIDVTDPQRPAAGVRTTPASTTTAGASPAAGSTLSTGAGTVTLPTSTVATSTVPTG
jgi:hypothetical protein